jgi:uncharacterized protein YndB with AHSA1/START domain
VREVIESIKIRASQEEIMRCFTDQVYLKGWWGVERSFIDLTRGGNYVLTWNKTPKGFGYVSTGIVADYEPEKRLFLKDMMYLNPERPILGPMIMEIEISENNGLSELKVRQAGYREGPDWDWYYQAVCDAWPQALISLKQFIEFK